MLGDQFGQHGRELLSAGIPSRDALAQMIYGVIDVQTGIIDADIEVDQILMKLTHVSAPLLGRRHRHRKRLCYARSAHSLFSGSDEARPAAQQSAGFRL
jgi:hypothetical protein